MDSLIAVALSLTYLLGVTALCYFKFCRLSRQRKGGR